MVLTYSLIHTIRKTCCASNNNNNNKGKLNKAKANLKPIYARKPTTRGKIHKYSFCWFAFTTATARNAARLAYGFKSKEIKSMCVWCGYKVSAQTIVRVDVRYIYLLTCAL